MIMRKVVAFTFTLVILTSPGWLGPSLYVHQPDCSGKAEFSAFGSLYVWMAALFLIHVVYRWAYEKLENFFR